jgi:hypothetical protein
LNRPIFFPRRRLPAASHRDVLRRRSMNCE